MASLLAGCDLKLGRTPPNRVHSMGGLQGLPAAYQEVADSLSEAVVEKVWLKTVPDSATSGPLLDSQSALKFLSNLAVELEIAYDPLIAALIVEVILEEIEESGISKPRFVDFLLSS